MLGATDCFMTLTDEQKQIVAGWIEDGATLNEIQKRLQDELEVSMTYLDVRLLAGELNLVPKEKEKPEEKPEEPAAGEADPAQAADPAAPANDLQDDLAGMGGPGGNVSVSIDQIARPNAMISGKATFSDGQKAEWSIDTMGRLSLDPATPGYRPSEQDVMDFQMELQKLARQQGI